MTYPEALEWLYATQLFGIQLGLANIRRLAEALAIRLGGPGAPAFIHVAGTNGKGSVCAMIDAVSRADGRRTGLFTSPHLIMFRERIRVDGEAISETEVAAGLSEIRRCSAGWDQGVTFFEIATALALLHFQQRGCGLVVLETGMGGRLDATNVVRPAACVITPIGLDHQQWLGATLGEIAREKAGIFKSGVPVVSAPQLPEAAATLRAQGVERGVSALTFVEERWSAGAVNLAGSHQRANAALALRALTAAGLEASAEAARRGLAGVAWPGRFQRVGGRYVLDGAHNPAAAARLVETWREEFGASSATLVLGILADKEMRGICGALRPLAARVIAVAVQNPRSSPPEAIAAVFREIAPELECAVTGDLAAALRRAALRPEPVLICGSLFLVGEALAHFQAGDSRPESSAQ